MESLISVIIPVYNNEKYLCDCLESILAQTYRNIQIIVIDDGSTDMSGEILDQYVAKDNRIEVFHLQNRGVSSARNTGLSHALGEYITFVDSDDTIEPNMYEYLLGQFSESEIDIVHCGYEKINIDGTSSLVLGTNEEYCFNRINGMIHLLKGDLFTGALWNKIYRHSIVDKLHFEDGVRINEDVLFNYYAFKKARTTKFIDKPFYHYYERENASTKITKIYKKSFDCMNVAKIIYEESKGEVYETIARSKYIIALMNQYRALMYKNIRETTSERKKIQKLLNSLLIKQHDIKRKYIYNYRVMTICPRIYLLLYGIYDKVRKPNWDIKKKL